MAETRISKLLDKVDDYEETISALLSFSHIVRWDDDKSKHKADSYFFIGRKMETSEQNRIQPIETVTPDLIVQRDMKYGIVGEAKKTFPKEVKYWNKTFEQLQKYDDDLKGWKTSNERIEVSDIVLLTHYTRKVDVSDRIKEEIDAGEVHFNKNFSIVAFSRGGENKTYLYLEKAFGNLSVPELDEKLRKVITVPLEKILPIYNIKFYDAKPPVPFTMCVLWENVFTQIPSTENFMEAGGRKNMKIEVNIYDLTEMVREQFALSQNNDTRQPEIPKTKWIREAMETFVKLKYAENKKESNDDYIVKYKRLENPLRTFTEKIADIERRKTLDDFA